MSFFLLGQGRDSLDLRLISDQVFATKHDAMAELANITAEPDFPHWDADVVVMDLDAGTPVLLVKPRVADVPVETGSVIESTDEAVAQLDDSDEPALDESAEEAVDEFADEPAEEAVQEAAEEATEESVEESAVEIDIAADEATDDSADELETAGVWESPEPETSIADDLVTFDEISDEPDDSLAQAIKRATGALEDEGITAPESIGPAEDIAEVSEATEPVQADTSSDDATDEQPAASWPWAVAAEDASAQPEVEAGQAVDPPAEVAPYVPDPFEDPAIDVGSAGMVSLPAEGDGSDASGPVILGEYGAAGIAGDLVLDEIPASPMSESVAADAEPAKPGMDLENSTCEECVYAETCPNKGELDPKSCGSFQWK